MTLVTQLAGRRSGHATADGRTGQGAIAERLRNARCHGRANLQFSRHIFQGEPTYILRDPLTFESHRLSRDDYHIFSRLTDDVTLGQLFEQLCEEGRVDPSQETSFYQFVVRLQQQGLLSLPGNAAPLYTNHVKRVAASGWQTSRMFFLRVPLLNPDALLNRTMSLFRPLFCRPAVVAWVVLMAACGVLLVSQWSEFVHPLSGMLHGHTFFIAWATLLGLKVIHEFGHAYACKNWGGDVPEMGAYFIVLNPCAYVDASAAWGMPSRWHRIAISLGGMYFESLVGAASLFIWTFTDAGLVHDVAHHLVVMSTTVTILFNANPLLRYDGYFILCDLWGRPNLRREALAETLALLKRVALGSRPDRPFQWGLIAYGFAASIYKLTVVMALSMIVSRRFLWLGIGMAAMYLVQSVGANLFRAVRHLLFSPEALRVRWRARFACLAVLTLPCLALLAPMPGGAVATGALVRQNEASIHLREGGVLEQLLVRPGDHVQSAQSLALVHSNSPTVRLGQIEAELAAARRRQAISINAGSTVAEHTAERVVHLRQRLQAARQQHSHLAVPSPLRGEVVSTISSKQLGAFLTSGTPVATVASGPWTARVLVTESQMAKMNPRVGMDARCQLDALPQVQMTGRVTVVSRRGGKEVRDPRMTQMGGGAIAVIANHAGAIGDPIEVVQGVRYQSLAPHYEIEITIDASTVPAGVFHGMQVQTRLSTQSETVGEALWRRAHRFWESMLMN